MILSAAIYAQPEPVAHYSGSSFPITLNNIDVLTIVYNCSNGTKFSCAFNFNSTIDLTFTGTDNANCTNPYIGGFNLTNSQTQLNFGVPSSAVCY